MKNIITIIAAVIIANVMAYSLIRCIEEEEAIRAENDRNRIENVWRVSR